VKKIIRHRGLCRALSPRDFFLPRWRMFSFAEDGVRLSSEILDLRLSCGAMEKSCYAPPAGQAIFCDRRDGKRVVESTMFRSSKPE